MYQTISCRPTYQLLSKKNNNDAYQKLGLSSVGFVFKHFFIIPEHQVTLYTNNGFILHSDIYCILSVYKWG